jgi:hypothetical protein
MHLQTGAKIGIAVATLLVLVGGLSVTLRASPATTQSESAETTRALAKLRARVAELERRHLAPTAPTLQADTTDELAALQRRLAALEAKPEASGDPPSAEPAPQLAWRDRVDAMTARLAEQRAREVRQPSATAALRDQAQQLVQRTPALHGVDLQNVDCTESSCVIEVTPPTGRSFADAQALLALGLTQLIGDSAYTVDPKTGKGQWYVARPGHNLPWLQE